MNSTVKSPTRTAVGRVSPWIVWVALTLALGALTLWPESAHAQGRVIPRPCARPVPPRCTPNIDCGGVAVMPCPVAPIERISSDVQASLEGGGRVVRYEITEKFVNRGPGLGEADYIFPLPNGAAFEDLRLEINGELVSGETLPADKARQIYEDIVRRQRDPALVEWIGYGLVRARIFPLPTGEEKKVVVRFRSVVRREGSALRVDYARGTEPGGQRTPVVMPAVERSDDDERTTGWSRFTLTIPRGADYGEPYSPTHSLRIRDRGDRREVRASGTAGNITVLLPLRRPNEPSITVVAHAPDRENGYALIAISPPAARTRALPRDVTFVVDVSGSMRGAKLEQAKAAGRAILASLEHGDRFRVIDFSTDVHSYRDGFIAATPENIRDARRYIEGLRAEGSTNISGALEEALDVDITPTRSGRLERMPFVVFVTDGEPTVGERNPDLIAAMAARLRNEARVFTFGVGAEIHAGLIEQLALEGRGTAHFVSGNESVERSVSLLAQRLTSPVLSNVRVRAEGVRLTNLHPVLPIDLFAGQDLVLLARYDGSGEARIQVETDSPDGRLTWTRDVRFPGRESDNAFVGRLWAAQRLGWLAAEKRKRGASSELDAEIKSLGEKFGIPTEFSSYLVLEPGMTVTSGLRRDAAMPATAPANAASGRANEERARRLGEGSLQLSSVVVTGTASESQRKEQEFAAAKQAAQQRDAKSLADVDAASQVGDELQKNTRQVEQRTFKLVNGVWTDVRQTPTMRTVQVKPFSPLYFELVQQLKGLGPTLALGERVIVAGRAVAIEFASNGLERMSDSDLRAVVAAW